MTLNWRIYYDDQTTFDNTEGAWKEAPAHGVVCVVVRDPTETWGRFVNSGYAPKKACSHCGNEPGNEYFVCVPESNEPWPIQFPDLADFKARFANPEDAKPWIKTGRMVPQEVWEKIMVAACDDPDFPKGSPKRRASDWKSDGVR